MKRWYVISDGNHVQCSFVGVNLTTCVLYLICNNKQVRFCGFLSDDYVASVKFGRIFQAFAVSKNQTKKIELQYRQVEELPKFIVKKNPEVLAAAKSKAAYQSNIKQAQKRWK